MQKHIVPSSTKTRFCANEQCPFNYFTLCVSLGKNCIFMKIAALNYNRRRRNYVIFNFVVKFHTAKRQGKTCVFVIFATFSTRFCEQPD